MRKALCIMVLVTFCSVLGGAYVAYATTADDVKAMAEKALAYWKANGKDKAVAEFNNPAGQFRKPDIYVGAVAFNGLILANGGNPKLTGMNLLEERDPTGKYFIKENIEVAKKGGGWVEYSWTNPETKKIQPRKVLVTRVPGEDVYISCGTFK